MTLEDSTNEFQLGNSPSDLISAVKFAPQSNQFLLVSSWDGSVRLYDVTNNSLRKQYNHELTPVLDCCFQDPVHAWSGDLNGQLESYDYNSFTGTHIGNHDAAIKCVEYCPDVQVIITGSWDKTMKLWDPRSPKSAENYRLTNKVYTMAVSGDKVIIGTAGKRVLVYDLRQMSYVMRDSSLKYQTRCIRCFPNGQGYVLSSIEGRVAVEYLDHSPEVQKKKYAFKCHRIKESSGVELIYPVNAITFHSGYNTFATGGSDGYVNVWDGFNKKRLCQFRRYPTHISGLAFSPDGTLMAIASSFIYDPAEKKQDGEQDAIFVRTCSDQETKPK